MRFNRNTYHSLGEKKYIVSIILIVLVFGGIFLALHTSKVGLQGDTLKISGVYGMNVSMNDIKDVSLKDSLPQNLIKNDGIEFFGGKRIGKYKSDDLGKIKMYSYTGKGPYLYITLNCEDYKNIVIAYKDKKQTEALYQKIADKKSEK